MAEVLSPPVPETFAEAGLPEGAMLDRRRGKLARFVRNMQGTEHEGLAPDLLKTADDDLIALTDARGNVKGYALVSLEQAPGGSKTLYVDRLYVQKQYRGGGPKLLRAVEDRARSLGCRRVELHSLQDARNFYLREGFRQVGPDRVMRRTVGRRR